MKTQGVMYAINRLAGILVVVFLAGWIMGCASAKDRFEEGSELEAQGRYADAANRYIDALFKDKNLVEARERLLLAGNNAIEEYLNLAARAGDAGRYRDAAEQYQSIDRLVDRANTVEVALTTPDTYVADRRAVLDEAIAYLMEQGVTAENEGDWTDAARYYGDILTYYDPNPDQIEVAERARLRALVRWGEAELARQRYRAAFDRANEAIELAGGPDQAIAQAALALRDRAVEEGTLFVAVLPVWRTEAASDNMNPDLIEALNDELQLDHWANPPLFIALAEHALVRRELRELGLRRRSLTNRQIGQTARLVQADLAVYGEIDRFSLTETDRKDRTRRVETRSGQDTTFVEEQGRMRYDVRVSYAIVDDRGRAVAETTVSTSESMRFKRGIYNGDYTDLKLSRNQRKLFDKMEYIDDERKLIDKMVKNLAEKLTASVYDRLIREVD